MNIRVLHVTKIYFPEIFGGIQRVVFDMCEGTSKHGVRSRVFALSKEPRPEPFKVDHHEAVTVHQQAYIASTGLSFKAFQVFSEQARQADIIHYHFPWPFMDVLHYAAAIDKPYVISYHSDIVKQRGLLNFYRPLMHRFLSGADHLIAASPQYMATSDVLQRYTVKTELIPYGIPPSEIVPANKAVEHWKERVGEDFFLFLGALRYYKGLPVLLEAARQTGLPVVIGGTGTEEEKLKASAPRNVHFVGHYTDEDRAALLSVARAFVFPSNLRSEAFGISLLEASRAGLPLICCEIGTGTTFINQHDETGIVVPPNDSAALARAMEKLSSNPTLSSQLGRQARLRFERNFTTERMADRITDLYRQLVSGSPS